jgi:hypothetical protein
MPHFHRTIIVVGVLAVFTGLANAQSNPLTCTTSATVTPPLRGEGFTELTGDIGISCTGGTPPSAGAQIPQDSITVFYNTTVTSRLLPTVGNPATNNISEALLIIDEPGSFLPSYGSSLPQVLCTTPLIGCTATVGAVPGPTLNTAVSSGSTPAPNVYQGVVNGNTVTFYGIPVLAPGASGTRVFRITNVRVSAQPLAPASNGAGAMPVQASVVISGGLSLPIPSPDLVVGFVSNGLTAGAGSPATLSQCSSQTKTAVDTLTFTENFGTAFKTRVFASTNTSYAGQINSPNYQNIPGQIYNSESNFVLPIDATNVAGSADYGTRLKATFNNVPTGVRIFVSTANVNNNGLPATPPSPIGGSSGNGFMPGGYTGYAQLVNGETTSDGNSGALGFLPAVPATDYGPLNGNVPIAEIPIVNGTGTAVWEAVNTNPNTIEAFRFAVYATYAANAAQNSPPPGLATVNLSFAATAGSGVAADAGSPMPRFASDPNSPPALFAIQSCTAPATLTIAKTHSGNFTQGQSNAAYTVVVSNQAGAGPTGGTVTVTENVPAGLTLVSMAGTGWTCPGTAANNCTRSDVLNPGSSYPAITVTVNVSGNAPSQVTNQVAVSGGGSTGANAGDLTTIGVATCTYSLSPTNAAIASGAGTGTLSVITSAGCSWTAVSNATSWLNVTSGTSGSGSGTVGYSFAANPNPTPRSASITVGGQPFILTQTGIAIAALRFVPVTPCRIADTRNPTGPFGGPALAGNSSRDFVVPSSSCGIPASAAAYSLNVTVVPLGPLQYISVWPAGQPQPVVSTLNSFDGRIKANAAIVPAGLNGAFSVFATDPTHVVVDIDGYFVPAIGAPNLAFYPVTPCRIADTRNPTGTLGAPSLAGGVPRTFPVPSSSCGIPASAQAYALNMTVVPTAPVGYLTTWPAGSSQPIVSTLNAPTGTVTSNAAIVPAGVNGAITVFATNATDLIVDINGYFAPPGLGSLDFYTATPCRVLDTRNAAGSLGGPIMGAGQARSFNVPSSTCGIPATAKAYSLNATVVPSASLQYLTLWGSGSIPIVSTLNSFDGSVVANAALVTAGASGEVTAFTTNLSHLLLDINGYFR